MINGLIRDFGSWKEFSGRGRLLPSVAAVTLCCAGAPAAAQDALTVHVYGPGGPGPAMTDSAQTFNARYGANVIVTAGPTANWQDAAM